MSRIPAPVIVTEKDDGTTVTIAHGGLLIIRLNAIPGTGYGWQVVQDASPQLEPVGKKQLKPAINGDKDGGPEEEIFQFRAVTQGSNELVLHYRRSWERQVAPNKTYRLRIIAQ